MNFVIIGGGPTGVELARSNCRISRHTLAEIFGTSIPRRRVSFYKGDSRLLAAYPPDLSESAAQQLTDLGVEVRHK